jgi:catalase
MPERRCDKQRNAQTQSSIGGSLNKPTELLEALELAKSVRRMVRAENVHARGIARHGQGDTPTSRDDTDMLHANLYEEWSAKRLDALIRALTTDTTGD